MPSEGIVYRSGRKNLQKNQSKVSLAERIAQKRAQGLPETKNSNYSARSGKSNKCGSDLESVDISHLTKLDEVRSPTPLPTINPRHNGANQPVGTGQQNDRHNSNQRTNNNEPQLKKMPYSNNSHASPVVNSNRGQPRNQNGVKNHGVSFPPIENSNMVSGSRNSNKHQDYNNNEKYPKKAELPGQDQRKNDKDIPMYNRNNDNNRPRSNDGIKNYKGYEQRNQNDSLRDHDRKQRNSSENKHNPRQEIRGDSRHKHTRSTSRDKDSRRRSNSRDRNSKKNSDSHDRNQRPKSNSRDRNTRRKSNSQERNLRRKSNSRDRNKNQKSRSRDRNSRQRSNSRDRHSKRQSDSRDKNSRRRSNSRERHSKRQSNSRDRDSRRRSNSRDRHSKRQSNSRDRDSRRRSNSRDRHSKRQNSSRDRDSRRRSHSRDRHSKRQSDSRERKSRRRSNSRDRHLIRQDNSRDRDLRRKSNSQYRDSRKNSNSRDRISRRRSFSRERNSRDKSNSRERKAMRRDDSQDRNLRRKNHSRERDSKYNPRDNLTQKARSRDRHLRQRSKSPDSSYITSSSYDRRHRRRSSSSDRTETQRPYLRDRRRRSPENATIRYLAEDDIDVQQSRIKFLDHKVRSHEKYRRRSVSYPERDSDLEDYSHRRENHQLSRSEQEVREFRHRERKQRKQRIKDISDNNYSHRKGLNIVVIDNSSKESSSDEDDIPLPSNRTVYLRSKSHHRSKHNITHRGYVSDMEGRRLQRRQNTIMYYKDEPEEILVPMQNSNTLQVQGPVPQVNPINNNQAENETLFYLVPANINPTMADRNDNNRAPQNQNNRRVIRMVNPQPAPAPEPKQNAFYANDSVYGQEPLYDEYRQPIQQKYYNQHTNHYRHYFNDQTEDTTPQPVHTTNHSVTNTHQDTEQTPSMMQSSRTPDGESCSSASDISSTSDTTSQRSAGAERRSISTADKRRAMKHLNELSNYNINVVMGRPNSPPLTDEALIKKVFNAEFQSQMDDFLRS